MLALPLVRLLHVVAAATALGGAALVWIALRDGGDEATLALAARYEWLFWGAMGLLALTGVGNVGRLAPATPGPTTAWGATLAAKLLAVLGVLALSAVRTLAVVRMRALPGSEYTDRGRLRLCYALSALTLLAVFALAEMLAHG